MNTNTNTDPRMKTAEKARKALIRAGEQTFGVESDLNDAANYLHDINLDIHQNCKPLLNTYQETLVTLRSSILVALGGIRDLKTCIALEQLDEYADYDQND